MNWGSLVRLTGLILFVGLLAVLAQQLSEHFGVSISLETASQFNAWIESLGWIGPLGFVVLVVARLFIGLSSHIVLTLGGMAFGVTGGIIWGATGLTISAVIQYLVARLFTDRLRTSSEDSRYRTVESQVSRFGVAPVFLITAHPLGPQTLVNVAAGLLGLPFFSFVLAIALSTPIRAGFYAVLGASVLTLEWEQIVAITVGLIVLAVLPFLLPRVRSFFQ